MQKKNPFFTWKDLTTHILWQTLRWKLSCMGHGNTVDRWLESSDYFEARTLTGSGLFALLKQRVHAMWIFATWSWCMWSHKSTPLFLWTQQKITPAYAMINDLLNIVFFEAFSLNASFLCVSLIEVIFLNWQF